MNKKKKKNIKNNAVKLYNEFLKIYLSKSISINT